MTKVNFKNEMEIYGDDFYEDTRYNLQAEIIRMIMNHKVISDFEKITLLNQYTNNLVTNNYIVENLERANEI